VTLRVCGCDLSLRATALVVLPDGWNGDWSQVVRGTDGIKLSKDASVGDQIIRRREIAKGVVRFSQQHHATYVAIEGPGFAATHSPQHSLGELAGVVKDHLAAAGYLPRVIGPSVGRALVRHAFTPEAGKGRMGEKDRIRLALFALGCPTDWSDDEYDALVTANALLAEVGTGAIVVPEPAKVASRGRRAA